MGVDPSSSNRAKQNQAAVVHYHLTGTEEALWTNRIEPKQSTPDQSQIRSTGVITTSHHLNSHTTQTSQQPTNPTPSVCFQTQIPKSPSKLHYISHKI
jgi:hypothetical protein